MQDEHGDDDVLDDDARRLAVGAEREAAADVVGQRDEVRRRLEQVAREADACGRAGAQQLAHLRHLDDRRRRDDGHADGLGRRERHARRRPHRVKVLHEPPVALCRDQLARRARHPLGQHPRHGLHVRPDRAKGVTTTGHFFWLFCCFVCCPFVCFSGGCCSAVFFCCFFAVLLFCCSAVLLFNLSLCPEYQYRVHIYQIVKYVPACLVRFYLL